HPHVPTPQLLLRACKSLLQDRTLPCLHFPPGYKQSFAKKSLQAICPPAFVLAHRSAHGSHGFSQDQPCSAPYPSMRDIPRRQTHQSAALRTSRCPQHSTPREQAAPTAPPRGCKNSPQSRMSPVRLRNPKAIAALHKSIRERSLQVPLQSATSHASKHFVPT